MDWKIAMFEEYNALLENETFEAIVGSPLKMLGGIELPASDSVTVPVRGR